MAKRKSTGKRLRFEVFKRDGFVCQYCGAHPPAVILHADHIVAVANGGETSLDNLVTACQNCNMERSAIPLSSIPLSLAARTKELAEREAQLRGYQSLMQERIDRIDEESWRIVDTIEPGASETGFNRRDRASIKKFIEKLGFFDVLDSAEIAVAKGIYSNRQRFLYFCVVCWKKLKVPNEG